MLVIAGMPEGGLTTLTDVSLMETDRLAARFRRRSKKCSIASAKSKTSRSRPTTPSKGETAATIIPALIRKYPNVYVIRDFSDTEAAKLLINEVRDDDRLVITNVHAKERAEALLRMLQLKVPHKEFRHGRDRRALHAADSQTVRRLQSRPTRRRPTCSRSWASRPARSKPCTAVPKPEEVEKPCKECGGLGFKGRTGDLRAADGGRQDVARCCSRSRSSTCSAKRPALAGMRPFQEEGLLLVAKGVTSLAELQRVLKE